MTEVVLNNVSVTENGQSILKDVSATFSPGSLSVILGPNGAGKTTLFRQVMGFTKYYNGLTTIDNVDSHHISSHERALRLAYLPQSRPLAWPITVKDTVALGRFAHGATLGRLSDPDEKAVQKALDDCDLKSFAHRRTDTLSGGELARMHCARAFAAEAPLTLADEPVVALDPRHQFMIMQLFRDYVDRGNGAVVILHDPQLAARFADRLIWMSEGQILADGSVSETLTEERLNSIYGISSKVSGSDENLEVSILGI